MSRPTILGMLALFAVVMATGVGLVIGDGGRPDARGEPGAVTAPIAARYQTALQFGLRSQWLQPWRGYQDTPPATRLLDAIGINFQRVDADEAPAAAALLEASGIHRARVEIPWGDVAFEHPDRLATTGEWFRILRALHDHHIRPLILLNANDHDPAPLHVVTLSTVTPARRGDRTVRLDATSAGAVVPGLTGFNAASGKAADVLITAVGEDDTATLSKPLPADLPAGEHAGSTLRFSPFSRPRLGNGAANPRFEATMAGWLDYVKAVTSVARRALGGDGFDVEVWNELSFASDFLDINTYYSPPIDRGLGEDPNVVTTRAILERTIAWLRTPANGVPRVGIGDGFASQRPWESGGTEPVGLTAIDRHPYPQTVQFPHGQPVNGVRPTDALGRPEGRRGPGGVWYDDFVPTYQAFFPEYYLTGIQTETIIRDLSPITTDIQGTPHGRFTRPRAGLPAPNVWITEIGQLPEEGGIPTWAASRFRAKSSLRTLLAFVNKGAAAVDLFATKDENFPLVAPAFFRALDRHLDGQGPAPGTTARDGGETTAAISRLVAAFKGPRRRFIARPLSLTRIDDPTGGAEFAGDGTARHPPLYFRDLVAFFPFQVSDRRWVAGAYVMTRDLGRVRQPERPAGDPERYDLPTRTFSLSVDGFPTCRLAVSMSDPLNGRTVPVRVRGCRGGAAIFDLPLNDSPRLLTVVAR